MAAEAGERAPGEHPAPKADRQRPAPLYKRLPRGPHRLGRHAVAQHQRLRIHGAMVQALASDGYDPLSVREVIALAGVSRRSFYEQFASKQECFLATFDVIARQQLASARHARKRASGGPERRLEAVLASCADAVASDRQAAALVLVEALTVGAPGALRLHAASTAWERILGPLLDGAALAPTPAGPTAAAVLGGMHGIMAARLREPSPPARLLFEQLRWWVLAPRVPASGAEARRLTALLRDGTRPGGTAADVRRDRPDARERMLAAVLRLAARHPVPVLSAVQIADEADVPLEAFFEQFDDRDACLRAALAGAGAPLLELARGAAATGEGWAGALRETLAALLSHLGAHPLQARALTVLAPCAGSECRRYGMELEAELAALLGAGYPDRGALAGEALLGAIWHLVRCHLADRRIRRLDAAAGHLTLLALAPVLGPGEAAAVLAER